MKKVQIGVKGAGAVKRCKKVQTCLRKIKVVVMNGKDILKQTFYPAPSSLGAAP
jgi:hypothetical protein